MRFVFSERKAAQAAAQLLVLHGGSMPYIKLIKLLYIADRESLIKTGWPITGDRMVAMKHGPVLSETLDLIRCTGEHPFGGSVWQEYVTSCARHDVRLGMDPPDKSELSPFEVNLLAAVNEQYGHIDKWTLRDHTHTPAFPEWKDPGITSVTIDPRSILENDGWSAARIQAAERDAKEAADFEGVLARMR